MPLQVSHTTVNARDAHALSVFWAALLDYAEGPDDPNAAGHEECRMYSRASATASSSSRSRSWGVLAPPTSTSVRRTARVTRRWTGRSPWVLGRSRTGAPRRDGGVRVGRTRGQRVLHPPQRRGADDRRGPDRSPTPGRLKYGHPSVAGHEPLQTSLSSEQVSSVHAYSSSSSRRASHVASRSIRVSNSGLRPDRSSWAVSSGLGNPLGLPTPKPNTQRPPRSAGMTS